MASSYFGGRRLKITNCVNGSFFPLFYFSLNSLSRLSNLSSCSFSANAVGNNILQTGAELDRCYETLGLDPECTKDELKNRYLELVKAYHPDTGGDSADVKQFGKIRDSYRFIIENDYGDNDRNDLEDLPKIFDINHTAPQHRQYLEYGGVGYGTPGQRLRQYQQHRMSKAAENVHGYMVDKLLASEGVSSLLTTTKKEAEYARRWKTQNAMERLVEDLIQESMRKGEFDKLPGFGKPLRQLDTNPYLDGMTQKLNRILVQNGYSPEWVMLEKELRQEIKRIRKCLRLAREKVPNKKNNLEENRWKKAISGFSSDCEALNKKIDHFNLVVPILSRQMAHMNLEKELKKIENALAMEEETTKIGCESVENAERRTEQEGNEQAPVGVLTHLFNAFKT